MLPACAAGLHARIIEAVAAAPAKACRLGL
jgi:hypothetical protein